MYMNKVMVIIIDKKVLLIIKNYIYFLNIKLLNRE